jgi:hypothetical protein
MVGVVDLLARVDVDEDCHFWSLLSFRRPQCVSLRDESNVRSTCRFKALMTPMRAIMVGPLCSPTRNIASTAACQSASCCSAFESFWIYFAACSRVTSSRPLGSGIGSWNGAANGPNPSCRIRSESHPAAWALRPFRARYISDRARRGAAGTDTLALPTVDRGGFHTPSRNPRTEHISSLAKLTRTFATNLPHVRFGHASAGSSGLVRPDVYRPEIVVRQAASSQPKIWADIGTFPSASPQVNLYIGQPNVVRPSDAADRCPVAALVARAIDQETANASGVHFSEGDLLAGEFGHAPSKGAASGQANRPTCATRNRRHFQPGCYSLFPYPPPLR